jgi:hypothetical protein
VIQKGLAKFERSLKERRNYYAGINRAYDRERLHYTAAASATRFLQSDANVGLVPCPGAQGGAMTGGGGTPTVGDGCVVSRGGVIEPVVYIDELPIMGGLEVLESYHPSEFHSIEVFGDGATIRAYTYAFMEKMAIRPRAFIVPPIQLRGEIRKPGPIGGGPD